MYLYDYLPEEGMFANNLTTSHLSNLRFEHEPNRHFPHFLRHPYIVFGSHISFLFYLPHGFL